MALQDAQGIVDSYLQGIQLALARKQQANEQQYRTAETQRAQAQTDLIQKQFQEELKQRDLAHKASQAVFELNTKLHGPELAQTLQPDQVDPNSGMGTYHVTGENGQPFSFQAPTIEQQRKLALLGIQQKNDADWQLEQKRLNAEKENRLAELGISNTNALALEAKRAESEKELESLREAGANHRNAADISARKMIESVEQGADPAVLTGGTPNTTPEQIIKLRDAALDGKLSQEDLARWPKGVQNGVRRLVTEADGVVMPKAKIDAVNHLAALGALTPQMQNAVDAQRNSGVVSSYINGHLLPITDPVLNKKFDQLAGQSANISKGIGGEEGQRLTNFSTQLTSGNYIPNKDLAASANQEGVNNYINQIHDVLKNETLANLPEGQKGRIMTNRGLDKLLPFVPAAIQKQQGVQQVAPPNGISADQFWNK